MKFLGRVSRFVARQADSFAVCCCDFQVFLRNEMKRQVNMINMHIYENRCNVAKRRVGHAEACVLCPSLTSHADRFRRTFFDPGLQFALSAADKMEQAILHEQLQIRLLCSFCCGFGTHSIALSGLLKSSIYLDLV